jgi:hypothetical protein
VDGKAWLSALLTDEFVEVRVRVCEPDVVFVKGVMEASEGIGAVFAEPRSGARDRGTKERHERERDGGSLVLVAPRSRQLELYELIEDLRVELGGALWTDER